MRRTHLSGKKLSEIKPGAPEPTRMTCYDVFTGLEQFVRQYMDGIATVTLGEGSIDRAVSVSPEHLAYAIRVTVEHLSDGHILHFVFSERDGEFCVSVMPATTPDYRAIAEIAAAWRSAGFKVKSVGFSIVLYTPFLTDRDLLMRQLASDLFKRILENYFFL
ncbi:MAG: hypothetical protein IKC87_02880 [Clostridia bacterium]|nr:hypothetical protein [Clostridia bacterium]